MTSLFATSATGTPRPRSIGSKAVGFRVMARQPDADGAVLTHAAGPGRGLQRPAAPVANDRVVFCWRAPCMHEGEAVALEGVALAGIAFTGHGVKAAAMIATRSAGPDVPGTRGPQWRTAMERACVFLSRRGRWRR